MEALNEFFQKVVVVLIWLLVIAGIVGIMWRIIKGSTPKESNLELYCMLPNDIKWLVGFQTAILVALLLLIVSKM